MHSGVPWAVRPPHLLMFVMQKSHWLGSWDSGSISTLMAAYLMQAFALAETLLSLAPHLGFYLRNRSDFANFLGSCGHFQGPLRRPCVEGEKLAHAHRQPTRI